MKKGKCFCPLQEQRDRGGANWRKSVGGAIHYALLPRLSSSSFLHKVTATLN